MNVGVLDMQPIEPAVGGGRLRLLGLYHALGDDVETRYVGTYDWPGEQYRRHHLSATLEEINVPLSDAHHAAAARLSAEAGGKTVIDIAFPQQAHLSPDFLVAARQVVEWADVVVFSHPWVYPLVADRIRPSQLIVYDSHNVEGFLRSQILDTRNPVERDLLRGVVEAEYQVGCRADLVLACSHEDRERFARIFEWPFAKMRVLPNGVMTQQLQVPDADERAAAKRQLGLPLSRPVAIFIGSAYGPNVEAARFIAHELSRVCDAVDFVIAGGVGATLEGAELPANVTLTGAIDEVAKHRWLAASDLGVNPMFSGSGTNIKMFDLMGAGLPVVTTAVGGRGITAAGVAPFVVVDPTVPAFNAALRALVADPEERARRAHKGRECVDSGYAWERISPHLGRLLRAYHEQREQPFFSVVIPSFDRHRKLDELMGFFEEQAFRDFEVIVVDQTPAPWPGESTLRTFPLTYVHTDVRGAVRARNTGADLARGAVIAFTDDDCRPLTNWLSAARRWFESDGLVGLEGAIESDHFGDPAWRPVTNLGCEGLGFMTANLFVRSAPFHRIDGFDVAFDRPHFREDTDFGWRLQSLGTVSYARDVAVFHPAQPRSIERESADARARFFEKDALLLAKHPVRYSELFAFERHWERTPGFWENFKRGARLYSVNIDDYLPFEPKCDLPTEDPLQ